MQLIISHLFFLQLRFFLDLLENFYAHTQAIIVVSVENWKRNNAHTQDVTVVKNRIFYAYFFRDWITQADAHKYKRTLIYTIMEHFKLY